MPLTEQEELEYLRLKKAKASASSMRSSKPAISTGEDVVRSFASGAARSLPDLANITAAAGNAGIEYIKGGNRSFSDFAQAGQNLTDSALGEQYQTRTGAGEYARSAGSFVGALPLGGVSSLGAGSLAKGAVKAASAGVGAKAGENVGRELGGETGAILGGLAGGIGGWAAPAAAARGAQAGIRGAATVAETVAPKIVSDAAKATGQVARNVVRGRNADQVFTDIIARSDRTPAQLLSDLKAGRISTIADIAGDDVQGIARAVAKTDGGKNVVARALEQRAEGATQRVANDLSKNVSGVDRYFDNLDDIAKQRAVQSAPLYKQAYAEGGSINDPALAKYLKDPRIVSAVDEAKSAYGVRREAARNSIETLDGAKKVLDDKIAEASRAGKTQLANELRGLKNGLVSVLDAAVPAYGRARKTFGGFAQLEEAQSAGLDFLKQRPEQISKYLRTLNADQQEAFRIGAREALQRVVSSTPDGANPARRIFGNSDIRNKVQAAIGSGKNYTSFAKRMIEETNAAKTQVRLTGGSRTDFNLAADGTFQQVVEGVAQNGILRTAIDRAITSGVDALTKRYYGIGKANAEEIAKRLVNRENGIEALERLIAGGDTKALAREASKAGVSREAVREVVKATAAPQGTKLNSRPEAAVAAGALGVGGLGLAGGGEQSRERMTIKLDGPRTEAGAGPDTSGTKLEEGYREKAYTDTVGKVTVGYGFNMQDRSSRAAWKAAGIPENFDDVLRGRETISKASAEKLHDVKQDEAVEFVRQSVPGFDQLDPARQEVLLDLGYQLGPNRFQDFKPTTDLIARGEFDKAARRLENAKIAQQAPNRVARNAYMLRTGATREEADKYLADNDDTGSYKRVVAEAPKARRTRISYRTAKAKRGLA